MDYRCATCLTRLRVTSGSSALAPDERCPVCASSLEKAPRVFTGVHRLVPIAVAPDPAVARQDAGRIAAGETRPLPEPIARAKAWPIEAFEDLPPFEPAVFDEPPPASLPTGRRRLLGLVLGSLAGGVGAGGLVLAPIFLGSEVPGLGSFAAGLIAMGSAAGFLLAPRRRN